MSVQFFRDPTADAELPGSSGYLAYFGSYTVDEVAGTFTATVDGALDASLVGTKQVRPFQLSDNKLIVGDQVTYRRVFERYRVG